MDEKKTCETCAYYINHYVKLKKEKKYFRTMWGHCFKPRIKIRRIDTVACDRYKERQEQ